MGGRELRESGVIAVVAVAVFGLALALSPIGEPWSSASALALLGAVAVAAAARVLRRHGSGSRAQLARLSGALAAANESIASEHAASEKLAAELAGLRHRVAAAERVAGESRVRLQRYDLIQRPGSFEIELYCGACNAWRPSGVISTWSQFERDEPFVTADDRFILSCGHEVCAANYIARPGAKVLTAAPPPRRWPAAEPERAPVSDSPRAA